MPNIINQTTQVVQSKPVVTGYIGSANTSKLAATSAVTGIEKAASAAAFTRPGGNGGGIQKQSTSITNPANPTNPANQPTDTPKASTAQKSISNLLFGRPGGNGGGIRKL
jgi:hypothetical protein